MRPCLAILLALATGLAPASAQQQNPGADTLAVTLQGNGSATTRQILMSGPWSLEWSSVAGIKIQVVGANAVYNNVVTDSSTDLPTNPPTIHRGRFPSIPNPGAYTLFITTTGPWQISAIENGFAKNEFPTSLFPSGMTSANPANPASMPMFPGQPFTSAPVPAAQPAVVGKMGEDEARAIVLITGDNAEGTGFMIKTPDGPAVVTNIHVIANNPNLKVTTNSGAAVTILSAKAASDRDLAMLMIQDNGYNYLDFSTDISKSVQPGDDVLTPGNSQGGEVMLNTTGTILGIGPERIEFSNPIYHGNSGGPVFHLKTGKVLGVVTEAMKVDLSDELDKTSFASRNSAISGSMRYFGLRLDTVSEWIPIDDNRFKIESIFLDQFDHENRALDSYLNSSGSSADSANNSQAAPYQSDEKIMKANDRFEQMVSDADSGQRLEALKGLLFDLQGIADTDVDQITNMDNFYSFDRDRARDELDYRNALKAELNDFGNNLDRLGSLPRSNN